MQIPTISYFFFIGSGVLLKNVLKDMFPTECDDKSNTWHVIFEGADDYETSTPLSHILDEENDCLLATKMNGENISPDHGYPIRVILPGIAGARNVKWLKSPKYRKGIQFTVECILLQRTRWFTYTKATINSIAGL